MLISTFIRGESPLLLCKFTDADAEAVANGSSRTARAREQPTPREVAASKLYTDSSGKPILPGPNIFRALIDAGRFTKSGRAQLTNAKSSLVPAGVVLPELECPIRIPGEKTVAPWEVDSRSVVNAVTNGRVMAHRPRFDAWEIAFSLIVDPAMFSAKIVRQLVDDAGSKIGLGAFRPSRKGPFGRFKVVGWEVALDVTTVATEDGEALRS